MQTFFSVLFVPDVKYTEKFENFHSFKNKKKIGLTLIKTKFSKVTRDLHKLLFSLQVYPLTNCGACMATSTVTFSKGFCLLLKECRFVGIFQRIKRN